MGGIFSNSIGRKLLMSLAGLFLISFLLVHMGINLLIIICDTTMPFNIAAHFMVSNIVIKVFEVVLMLGLLIHIVYAFILNIQNMMARPVGYKKANNAQTSFFSKYMLHTAIIIGVFLVIHLVDFYFKAKFGTIKEIVLPNGTHAHDMGALVIEKFKIGGYVIFYIASFLFLGFHLHHGFQSAFQTMGLNHSKYNTAIKVAGVLYTLLVTLGFTIIPLVIYFSK